MPFCLIATLVCTGLLLAPGSTLYAQSAIEPTNDGPNPYRTIENHFELPEGRTWGSTSAVEIDLDGESIWVAERCGQNSCFDAGAGAMSALPMILKFDANGNLVTSFGQGLMVFPHGIDVDHEGNVWVTDGRDNAPGAGGRGRGGRGGFAPRSGPAEGATIGHQVFKFSPEGEF